MRRHTMTKGFALTPANEARLKRRVARLEKRLRSFDPDLVHLQVVIEKHPRREEYTGSVRLVVLEQVLAASRNTAATFRTLLTEVFSDIEAQLDRLKAGLRGEAARGTARRPAFR
ncbi:MAG TPA: HPF/RaiA family ribosome-associated protein [Longimicrobiales bacterium]